MLDSFEAKNTEFFDAYSYAEQLCEGGRVTLNGFIKIGYQSGWKDIVKEFLDGIRNQPIVLLTLTDEFGALNVDFECRGKTMEVRVWRAIRKAQLQSVATCTKCGHSATRKISGDKVTVLCKACTTKAKMNGETGTWLDKY